jgi:hypothetical protein
MQMCKPMGRTSPFHSWENKKKLLKPSPPMWKLDARREMLGPRREMLDPRREMLDPRREMLDPRREMLDPRREMLDPRREMLDPRRRGYHSSIHASSARPGQCPCAPVRHLGSCLLKQSLLPSSLEASTESDSVWTPRTHISGSSGPFLLDKRNLSPRGPHFSGPESKRPSGQPVGVARADRCLTECLRS